MIGQHIKFSSNGLHSLPHIEDKAYRILDTGFINWLSNETWEFVHSIEQVTHVFLEGAGIIHSDHLNLPI